MSSTDTGWLRRIFQKDYLFLFATIAVFVVCLHPVYNSLTTMGDRIDELSEKQKESKKKIQELELEVTNLKKSLKLVTGQANDDRETLTTVQDNVNKTEMFVKEFYKNFTITLSITNLHNISIHSLLNLTHDFNETMKSISDIQSLLTNKTDTLTELVEQFEGCQSGYEVGEHTYPAQAFPLERTVKFDPPFKKTPAFAFGTTLLDSTSHLSVNGHLISLSKESFTIKIITWGRHYALYGARFSWIACPKYTLR